MQVIVICYFSECVQDKIKTRSSGNNNSRLELVLFQLLFGQSFWLASKLKLFKYTCQFLFDIKTPVIMPL